MSHDILYDIKERQGGGRGDVRAGVANQLITQEVMVQLAAAVGVEVTLAEMLAGGVTQKTFSYRVDFSKDKN